MKSAISLILFCSLVIFLIWINKYRKSQLKSDGKFVVAKITKLVHNLKNGDDWKCEFYHNNELQKAFLPRKMAYDVTVGQYYIIKYSTKETDIVKVNYRYLVKDSFNKNYLYTNWDTLPSFLLKSKLNFDDEVELRDF